MAIPENPLELSAEEQTKYFDGIKGFKNQVIDFEFILRLKKPWEFSGFVECIRSIRTETDYAGLHATDPNWFEYGRYQSGLLEPYMLQNFDFFLRLGRERKKLLQEDQALRSLCYFSEPTQGDNHFRDGWGGYDTKRRPDLMLNVEGGIFEHWGQFVCIFLVEGVEPFYLDRDTALINAIKNKAKTVGKQEQTDDEWKQEYTEERKKDKERDEAIKRYWEEESARWALEENS